MMPRKVIWRMGRTPHLLWLVSLFFRTAQKSAIAGGRSSFLPVRGIKARHDRRDVMLRGLGGNAQSRGDFGVAQAFVDQTKNLNLPTSQSRRISAGHSNGTARNCAHPAGAHLPPQARRRRHSAQSIENLQRLALSGIVSAAQRHRFLVRTTKRPPPCSCLMPPALAMLAKWSWK